MEEQEYQDYESSRCLEKGSAVTRVSGMMVVMVVGHWWSLFLMGVEFWREGPLILVSMKNVSVFSWGGWRGWWG